MTDPIEGGVYATRSTRHAGTQVQVVQVRTYGVSVRAISGHGSSGGDRDKLFRVNLPEFRSKFTLVKAPKRRHSQRRPSRS